MIKRILLFEDFTASSPESDHKPINTDTINPPCEDCALVNKQVKTELKRVNKISSKKKKI